MAYSAKSQKNYNDKCNRITLKYTEKETNEYKRLIEYIEESGIAKTIYIKELIKQDLDSKGIPYPDNNDNIDNSID